jgi:hypothetical protein
MMDSPKIVDQLRDSLRASNVPLGARAELEQMHAAFSETCREQGIVLDDNAVAAAMVALTAVASMRETLADGNPMVGSVMAMHDAMINIHGLTPDRYLLSALASAPAPL